MQTVSVQPSCPTLDEIVKCDKVHLRWILAWREPYCISSSRKEPIAIAHKDPEFYENFCCSSHYKQCPFYKPSILTRLSKGGKINPPCDVNQIN